MLYNRDLSWLSFNYRVLEEAKDQDVPLYERLRFLAIFSSNLDEFFRVRYPAVIAFSKLDKKTIRKQGLLNENDIAGKIQETITTQLDQFGQLLLDDLIPALEKNKIAFYYNVPFLVEHIAEIREIFLSKVLSFIQPVILGAGSEYNFLPENNQLYFIVTVKDAVKDTVSHVVVNIPSKKLTRFFTLSVINDFHQVVFIDDIIRSNMELLFPGRNIESIFSIKFNRDAEITLGDDYSDKLLDKIEKQLTKRDVGAASRFLFEKGMPVNLQLFLATMFKVDLSDLFEGGRYHNLSDLFTFPSFNIPGLFYKKETAVLYPKAGDIFVSMSRKDILLHLPYNSYTPVLSFFNQAAVDEDVTEIYITLYRVATESHIVNALISAAKNGKKVTAFIELKARFDEANNIKWSRIMKQAGVRLIYSESKIKVHSKIALVKKRETCFAILSTGNFNENTASFYTDHLVMTVNPAVCSELQLLFNFLQKKNALVDKAGFSFKELFVSQFNLLPGFERLINMEIEKARLGQKALIRIKVNNLEEPYFINLLYKASQAGVEVQLIIRSICCLVPGILKESENITVRKIVDKYLEHTRIFIFGAEEEAVVVIGSSDLMTRNLRRRIEVCLHVKDQSNRQQLLDYFRIQWEDNTKSTTTLSSMEQVRALPVVPLHNAQSEIYEYVKQLSVENIPG